ncbi:hypothetical protein HY994_04235 [Candidatus Micrarchaeota archaeon]|nr:hypothetical protein [Candidatus Micrarchaeota archaeon]
MARRAKPNPLMTQIYSFAQEVSGERGFEVAQTLGDGATDEKIEKKTKGKLKVAEIRATLNQLHQHGIVEYTREKNMSNGWFTYTWKINPDRAMRNLLTAKKREHEKLCAKMATEEGAQFYKCRKACMKLAFEQAMELQFRCPECNGKMAYAQNQSDVKALEDKIGAIEQILSSSKSGIATSNSGLMQPAMGAKTK